MVEQLNFISFQSTISSGFWFELREKKLHEYKLDESAKRIQGFYTNTDRPNLPCRLSLDHASFGDETATPALCFNSPGTLYNKNTIEGFKSSDLKLLMSNEGLKIKEAIESGIALKNPSILNSFFVLCFGDLKKHTFYYLIGLPVRRKKNQITLINKNTLIDTPKKEASITKGINSWCECNAKLDPFFVLEESQENSLGYKHEVHRLENVNSLLVNKNNLIFAFCDPSSSTNYPASALKNYLDLIQYHWGQHLNNEFNILCYRERFNAGQRQISHSLLLKLRLQVLDKDSSFYGWEKNGNGKIAPKTANLSSLMDPKKLAESSVSLNLKLMQWRLMPDLQLDMIANTKCLLLGSGTLGCNVARNLLGWGVKNITMLDCGKVSFSNPVRQTLFEFSDCHVEGGKPKAQAAADKLKKIFPGLFCFI